MFPLRQCMLDNMQVRHYSPQTQVSYVHWVYELSKHYRRAPDTLSDEELKAFLWHLSLERHLSTSSCLQAFHALRFFYREVLKREFRERLLPVMRKQQKIPDLLSPGDVALILRACRKPKYLTFLIVCYGCGTRIGETLNLKLGDIDGELRTIHIRQGKGSKDRLVPLSETVLLQLRRYWQSCRPSGFLFCGQRQNEPLHSSSIRKVYQQCKVVAGVVKQGGVHALRHVFATHQLMAGMPLTQLQKILGHSDVRTTLRYTHWLPHYQAEQDGSYDLVGRLGLWS